MKNLTQQTYLLMLAFTVCMFFACGGGGGGEEIIQTSGNSGSKTEVLPPTGADPNVSADQGGAGFAEIAADQGWETNTSYKPTGSPNAKKGGSITMSFNEYPAVFRYFGKNSNYQVTRVIGGLVYEGLLGYDAETSNYVPALATHWKISEDKKKYSFRIDPNARWSDGRPVTADDVVATYDLLTDEKIEDVYYNTMWPKYYNRPVKESKYIVSIEVKEDSWRNFLYYSGVPIMPAYHLAKIDGKDYLSNYQYQMLPGTGPYEIDLDKTKQGDLVVMKRRDNYWAEKYPSNVGAYNFDELRMLIVRERRLELEKFQKGEFDFYIPARAQWWVEELNVNKDDNVKRGLIQKRKIYNYDPQGMGGFAMNTNESPFNDLNVRKAFSYLFNFEQLNEKMFFDEYVRCQSWFPSSVFENKDNPKPKYDPALAAKLLDEAGWTRKAGDKYRKNAKGEEFELNLMSDESLERIFIPFQQDLENAGIKMNFKTIAGNERFKKAQAKDFKIHYQNWGGLLFPNPEGSMHSKYADVPDNTNMTGMANDRIDELIELYNKEYDGKKRVEYILEIDKIASEQYHYVMGWIAPHTLRCSYWNKYSYPKTGLGYTGDFEGVLTYWWYDEDKAKTLEKAQGDKSTVMQPVDTKIIDAWNKRGL